MDEALKLAPAKSLRSRGISRSINNHRFRRVSAWEVERMVRDWFAWLDTFEVSPCH